MPLAHSSAPPSSPSTTRPRSAGALLAFGLACLACAPGCGSSPAPEAPSESARLSPSSDASTAGAKPAATKPSDEPTVDASVVPSDCKSDGKLCLPNGAFVQKLCNGIYPDVALAYFHKDSPFTRGYLRGDVEAWNASGGVSSHDKLVFDEEVIVLRARKPADTGGMQVSGAGGGYDVLRWDGSCATLSDGELNFMKPPKAKNAKILWSDLPEATREILLGDEKLKQLNTERKRECKGATMGEVSKKCVQLVDKLSDGIASWVRAGGQIQARAKLP